MNNQPSQQTPFHETYRAIKLLGEGSFGKAYLVEGNISHVFFKNILLIPFFFRKNL